MTDLMALLGSQGTVPRAVLWLALALALLVGYAVARWLMPVRAAADHTDLSTSAVAEQVNAMKRRLSRAEVRLTKAERGHDRHRKEAASLRRKLADQQLEQQALAGRVRLVAARDRNELIRLQEEIEAVERVGTEKARLIRSLERDRHDQAVVARRSADLDAVRRQRMQASMAALEAALKHAKNARQRADERSARLREQLRAATATPEAGGRAIKQRPSDRALASSTGRLNGDPADRSGATTAPTDRSTPTDRIVYRDRPVPIEIQVEVPVGFTPFPLPVGDGVKGASGIKGARGNRPRYSENRPPLS